MQRYVKSVKFQLLIDTRLNLRENIPLCAYARMFNIL